MRTHPTFAEPHIRAIMETEYPRFSDGEYDHRRAKLATMMAQHDCGHLLIVGENRTGACVQWLTGWPVTVEGYVIFRPGEQERMYMEWYNHWPLARRIACQTDVRWSEHRGIAIVIDDLARRGAKRVGFIGPLAVGRWKQLASQFEMVDLGKDFVPLRLVKSAEEIEWLRIGAALSDLGQTALRE